jgi:hypothetical protein
MKLLGRKIDNDVCLYKYCTHPILQSPFNLKPKAKG